MAEGEKRQVPGKGWPIISEALAFHPDQVPEARRLAKKLGVPTEIRDSGEPVLRDGRHRKKYVRVMEPGTFDKNGGYSDP